MTRASVALSGVQVRVGELCLRRPQRSVETRVHAQLNELDERGNVGRRSNERLQRFDRLLQVAGQQRCVGGHVDAAKGGLDASLSGEIERNPDHVRMSCRVERQRTHERCAALELVSNSQLSGRSSETLAGSSDPIVRRRLCLRRGSRRPDWSVRLARTPACAGHTPTRLVHRRECRRRSAS